MTTKTEVLEQARYYHIKYPRLSMNEIVTMLSKEFSWHAVNAFISYLAVRYAQRKMGSIDGEEFEEDMEDLDDA